MSLTRDDFWSIIDRAHKDAKALRPLLEPLAQRDLLSFYRLFMACADELRYALPEGRKQSDSQQELAWWVVAQGRAFYDDVLAHPDQFPERMGPAGRGFRGK
jgi:hypothetical protein